MQDNCIYAYSQGFCSYNTSAWDCAYYTSLYDDDAAYAGYSITDCDTCSTDNCNYDEVTVSSTSGASRVVAGVSAAAAVLGAVALL